MLARTAADKRIDGWHTGAMNGGRGYIVEGADPTVSPDETSLGRAICPVCRPSAAIDPMFSPALVAAILRHLRVTTFLCSMSRTDTGAYVLAQRTVPDHNLIMPLEGRACWVVDGVDHVLAEGDCIIVPPGVLHHGCSLDRRLRLGSIHVTAVLPGGRDLFSLVALPRQRPTAPDARLRSLFRMAMDELDRGQEVATTLLPHWGPLVLKELLLGDLRAGTLRLMAEDALVAEVLRLLEGRIARPTTLADLVRIGGYSAQHLNRRFRRVLGITPLAYLEGLRLDRAAALLRERDWSVARIASAVGFADAGTFTRAFRRHFGRAPSDYRLVQ